MIRIPAALTALMLCPALAHAAPGDATRLEYARSERAARCPDRDSLQRAVSKRLGYDPFFPVARQTIVVEITDADAGLRAQMRLIDENGMIVGSRELKDETEHCDELVASLALAMSIALDPSAASSDKPPQRDVEPGGSNEPDADRVREVLANSEPSQPPIRLVPPTTPVPAPASRSKPSARSRAIPSTARGSFVAAQGVGPSLAFGLRVGTAWDWHWFRLLAEFADQFPATREAKDGERVKASLYEGMIAPCFARASFAACALLSFGALQSEGVGVAEPVKNGSTYAALGVRGEYEPQIMGPLHLLLDVDALKPLTPITLRLRGEQVWKTPFVSLAIGIGLAVRFP